MEGNGKLYYSITEVAERFGINASKLRYYEKEFKSLQPKKNRSGDRIYDRADIDHLTEILDLIDRQKFTLPGAREHLKQRDERKRENARYISRLQKIKSFLEKVRATLDDEPEELDDVPADQRSADLSE